MPETLLVLCHPLWDLAGVGHDEHMRQLRRFLVAHRRQLHAIELNGYRSRKENGGAQALALTASLPLDLRRRSPRLCAQRDSQRHTGAHVCRVCLRSAGGASEVVIMPEYRQNLTTRKLAAASDI